MNGLSKALILGSALSVLPVPAVAKVILHCAQSECDYDEEMGPSKSSTFNAWCTENTNSTISKMVCHKAEGVTCTAATQEGDYWSCLCTNWDPTERNYVHVDVTCSN